MALVTPGKIIYDLPKWSMAKKQWVSFGDVPKICLGQQGKIQYPCQLKDKIDINSGEPKGKPDGTWEYSKLEESKTIKQQIIEEIRSMLKEETYMPVDDTTGIGNMIPSTHKQFIKKLWDATRPYDEGNTPFSSFLRSFDSALRNGFNTDNLYSNFFSDYPFAKGLENQKPANFSYPQGGASAKGKTPAPSKPTAPRYFVCKIAEETQAVRNFQKSKGLTPDGKIGKNTYAAILADPSVLSAGKPFAQKGIKFEQALGLSDPKMKDTYQRSVCEALAGTAAAKITGGEGGEAILNKYDPKTGIKLKCPSFMKEVGPYTFEQVEEYVTQYIKMVKGDEDLAFAIANTVNNAIKRNPQRLEGCEQVWDLIKRATKTKGQGVPGLSSVESTEQANKSTELDNLNAARVAAKSGNVSLERLKTLNPEAYSAAVKYGVYNPKSANYVAPASLEESKNWIDRTRESTASDLLERLTKDINKKKVL